MNKIGLFIAATMLMMAACKSDTATSAVEPSAPSVPATTASNTPSPIADPTKGNEPAVPVGPITSVEFEETEYDFGTVMEGEKVVHVYKFKNTGDEPLIISNAKATCGCTVPSWPKEPIAPGEASEIKVQFDTKNKGKVGGQVQSKRVTITANTDPVNSYVTIKGKVDKEEGAEPAAKNPS